MASLSPSHVPIAVFPSARTDMNPPVLTTFGSCPDVRTRRLCRPYPTTDLTYLDMYKVIIAPVASALVGEPT
jgi:hypothetical protein